MAKIKPVEIADIPTSVAAKEAGVTNARIRQILVELGINYEMKAGRIFLTPSQVEAIKHRNTQRGRIPGIATA